MEFFKTINVQTSEEEIREKLSLQNTDHFNESFFVLEPVAKHRVKIGGIWGEFSLQRDLINGGVRFSLLECPNALAYTFTTGYPPAPNKMVMHLTINRKRIKDIFLEEIEEFMEDWKMGIEAGY